MNLVSNGVNRVDTNSLTQIRRLWKCKKFLCKAFGKGTRPFDFIKRKVIRKLADEANTLVEQLQ